MVENRKKISFILLIVLSAVSITMLALIAFNLQEYGYNNAKSRATAVAKVVEIGLTSHMLNKTMDKRAQFITQIEQMENIERLWLVRGAAIIKQYGEGLQNEIAHDEIDKEVLKTGKIREVHLDPSFASSSYRVTIPYKARTDGSIDCLSCHDAQVGDTLGAITIEMDVSDLKTEAMRFIGYISLFALFLILFVLLFVNRLIGPYLHIFDSIKRVMQGAQQGDYSQRITDARSKESKEVQTWVNTLLEKLQTSLNNIESNIHTLTHSKSVDTDPLIEAKRTVTRLSQIYDFRKALEHDEQLSHLYSRLAMVLHQQFKLDDLNIIEADNTKMTTQVVHMEKGLLCDVEDGCHAHRTNSTADSCQFHGFCMQMPLGDVDYICVPYSISNDLDLVISIITSSDEEADRVRTLLPSIEDYIDVARPQIINKRLMQTLERSGQTDALTGLYNRRYLVENVEIITQQLRRTKMTYGVLMTDIDHFKILNDTYGHDVGDIAIKTIADTLQQNVRASDTVIRLGGKEFIVLLYNCDVAYIKEVAEKIRGAFAKTKIKAETACLQKTISIGAAIFPEHDEDLWKCIKYADIALEHAKSTGRNRVTLFDTSLLDTTKVKSSRGI